MSENPTGSDLPTPSEVTAQPNPHFDIQNLEELLRLFESPKDVSLVKELDYVDANYAAWIAASPFVVLCTAGSAGLDASPRGDPAGFVRILDPKTLLFPDRRGNNRLDSLRNLISDPRLALLFLIPGLGETLRVNGRARLSTDPALLSSFAVQGSTPKLVLVVAVEAAYFQCSRAVLRADLWNPERHIDRTALPSPGKILGDATAGKVDGATYDRELPDRVRSTLY
ncbi:MAG TPA: pyridoxamine 5'-phosphate oxidase family protein [Polyangiaceae bacterium]|nr:pyridoxamine 5'-phosphate oxidase family protein [Polyangiaceae bacterium]